jgi:CRP-like cAMP-binding protein
MAQRAGLEIPFPTRTLVMPALAAGGAVTDQRDGAVDRLGVVSQIGLFAMLDQQARTALAAGIRTVEFGAGETISTESNPSGALHIIRSGEVSVWFSEGEHRREVATLKPGEVFCLFASMTGESRPARYAAKGDTSCYVVDHRTLTQLLATYPKLAEDLSTMLAAREMALDDKVKAYSAEIRARHAAETKSRLLARMQQVFRFG